VQANRNPPPYRDRSSSEELRAFEVSKQPTTNCV
jgi:hypothetical protein